MNLQPYEYKDKFEELQEVLEIVAENVPVGLIRIDDNGNLVYANDACSKIFGRPFKDLENKKFYRFFNLEDKNSNEDDIIMAWFGKNGESQLRITLPNGDVRFVEVKFKHIMNGVYRGLVGVVFDVTEKKKILPELLRLKENLYCKK